MVELSSSLRFEKVTEAMLRKWSELHQAVAKDLELKGQALWTQERLEPGALVAAYPSAQGRCVAPLLLEVARGEARNRGNQYVRLGCAAERPGIRRFYERQEFARVGERTVGPFFAVLYPWRLA